MALTNSKLAEDQLVVRNITKTEASEIFNAFTNERALFNSIRHDDKYWSQKITHFLESLMDK